MDEATAEDLAAFNSKFGTKKELPPESETSSDDDEGLDDLDIPDLDDES